ncbi:MAG: hypothetical protein JWN14_2034 [Chthonomonadales bacterium]|nr:hypothetical protein [Chthonomonadales bacterium]
MNTVQKRTVQALSLCALMVCGGQAFGQYRPQRPVGGGSGFGGRAAFRTVFTQAWSMPLVDPASGSPLPVKLIEVGQATDNKRINLLMLVGGKDVSDYKRRLLVTHWAGGQFTVDEEKEFPGAAVDALLIGKFRQDAAPVAAQAAPSPATPDGKPAKAPPKRKPAPASTSQQVITTEGVYTWRSGHLTRLFTAPPSARLAMILGGIPDVVVGGQGNQAQGYVMGETQSDPFTGNPPSAGDGYVHFGVGTQDYEGSEDLKMALGVRYVQSYWSEKNHWMIGIARPANAQNNTNSTNSTPPGERLVVLTPRAGKTDLDFWATKPADMEESWRSDPFPGHILDVRIGDPRNDGKESLLVLTSENNGKERHLYCLRPQQVATGQ